MQAEAKKGHGNVGVRVVASFNKMKELTSSWMAVARALEGSEIVEVSKCGALFRKKKTVHVTNDSWKRSIVVETLDTNLDSSVYQAIGEVVRMRYIADPAALPRDLAACLSAQKHKHKGSWAQLFAPYMLQL